MAREGLQSNRHQANSGPSGLNLVRCVFGAGRWPPGAGRHRRPLPRPDWSYRLVVAVVMARRKHLARGGVHVGKSDVSLSNAIRRGEIVKEIADHAGVGSPGSILQPIRRGFEGCSTQSSLSASTF